MRTKSLSLFIFGIFALLVVMSSVSATFTITNNGVFTIQNANVPTSVGQSAGTFTITFDINNTGATQNVDWTASTITNGAFSSFTPASGSSITGSAVTPVSVVVTFNTAFNGTITGNIVAEPSSVSPASNLSFSVTVTSSTPTEITACNAIGNPGSLEIRKIDFTNNGMQYKTFGKDDEWFPLDNVDVQIEIKNDGNDNVDNVEVSWGLYDTKTNQWVIDYDNEDDFNIKDGDKETLTVSFKLDDDLDVDLEDLSDGNNYKLYVTASGEVDNATAPQTCVSDFETASVVIESDFVVLDNFQSPETVQCSANVEVSADAWNIGDSDQDEVSVQVTNSELKLNQKVLVGDMNAFDNQKISFSFIVPNNAAEKTYAVKLEVLDDKEDVYQNDFDDDNSEFIVPLTVKGGCAGIASPVTVTANLVSGGKAGQDLVVKATVKNTGSNTGTYALSSSSHAQWASSYTVQPSILTLAAGQSGEATYTFKVNRDASGEQTFYIETLSGNEVTRQPVSVTITSAGFFDSITGSAISGSSWVWGLGLLNIVLILVIIFVAFRVMRK